MVRLRYKLRTVLLMALMVGLPWFQVAWADLNDGLVAYYPFDGNANDESGNGNDGTEHGGVSYAAGKIGQTASFDGVDDKILFSAISHDYFGNNDFSISFYFNIAQSTIVQSTNTVLSKREICHHGHFFDIRVGNERINFEIDDNLPQNYSILHYNEVNADQWYFYTAVKNGKNIRLYIDGDLVEEHSTTSVMDISNNATLGISNSPCIGLDGTTMLKGQVDEFRIYNRALSEVEVKQLYQIGDQPEPPEDCWAVYENGSLYIPCIKVMGPFGDELHYEADMQYELLSEPMSFQVTGAKPK